MHANERLHLFSMNALDVQVTPVLPPLPASQYRVCGSSLQNAFVVTDTSSIELIYYTHHVTSPSQHTPAHPARPAQRVRAGAADGSECIAAAGCRSAASNIQHGT